MYQTVFTNSIFHVFIEVAGVCVPSGTKMYQNGEVYPNGELKRWIKAVNQSDLERPKFTFQHTLNQRVQ